jgi:hypothetical protein
VVTSVASGVGGDLDSDLVLLEEVDQPECDVTAFLRCNDRFQFNRIEYPRGTAEGLSSHFPSLGAHSELDIGIVGNSFDLPSAGLSGDTDLPVHHVEPDRGKSRETQVRSRTASAI